MNRAAGFTLIEMLIVLAILAILMSIGFVSLINYQRTAAMRQAAFTLASSLNNLRSTARQTGRLEQLQATSGASSFSTQDGATAPLIANALPSGVTFANAGTVFFTGPHGLAQNAAASPAFVPLGFTLNGPGGKTIAVNVIGIGGKVVIVGY